jgi:xanthine dehydrogenase accessory factor
MELQPETIDRYSDTNKLTDAIIAIKGAGEMASGVAYSLYKANIRRIFMLEIASPLAVRRTVSFCESIHAGSITIEGVQGVVALDQIDILAAWDRGAVAVIPDPDWKSISRIKPDVVIDATLAKINLGTRREEAPLVIGLGPGFEAGDDVHLVIETHRGHDVGRIIEKGAAQPNTGIPGNIGGYTSQRVLRAPCDGRFESKLEIGAMVTDDQVIGKVGDQAVHATLSGVLRGLIRPGTMAKKGLKLGDIDPRGNVDYCYTVSDKARTLGGSVLLAVLSKLNRTESPASSLAGAIGLSGRGVISLIGAGGKTSLMFKLAKEMAGAGFSVLTTTTTKIFFPDREQSPHTVVAASDNELLAGITAAKKSFTYCCAGTKLDQKTGKLIGLRPETVDRIWKEGLVDIIIVEADGSKQLPLKASADHEPVLPSSTSHLVQVTGLDAMGQAVEKAVHRSDIFLKRWGLVPGTELTESHLANCILHEIQKASSFCHPRVNSVILNKADTVNEEQRGKRIAHQLKGHPYLHQMAILALKENFPVKFSSRI